jgi:hypothetical protein
MQTPKRVDDATLKKWIEGDTYLGSEFEDRERAEEMRLRLLTKVGIDRDRAWDALNTGDRDAKEEVAAVLEPLLQRHRRAETGIPLARIQIVDLAMELLGTELAGYPHLWCLMRVSMDADKHKQDGGVAKEFYLAARVDGLCLHTGAAKVGIDRLGKFLKRDKAQIHRWRKRSDYQEHVDLWKAAGPALLNWEYPEPPDHGADPSLTAPIDLRPAKK